MVFSCRRILQDIRKLPMESLRIPKFPISFASSFVLLSIVTTSLNLAFATEDCKFPAIFNFGDSNSDTGGISAAFIEPGSPYGDTYFHRPSGRICDGRLIIDFMAHSFGLPYLSAYLDSLGANFTHGANFATAGSTIDTQPPGPGSNPFSLGIQYNQFKNFISKTQFISHHGGIFASLMPKNKSFGEALYTFDIGQNDVGIAIMGNKTLQEVNDYYIPAIIESFSTIIQNIYNLGGRYFWIHNTGPIGCLPYILAKFLSAERDESGCVKFSNEVSQSFNHKLKEAVVQLRKDLPQVSITYVDIYAAKYSLFSNSTKYGFEKAIVACCGYGGEYNYGYGTVLCGKTIEENGTKTYVGSCEKPSVRVNWDGVHYTEAANDFIFHQISSGKFSDPPLPPHLSCHKCASVCIAH